MDSMMMFASLAVSASLLTGAGPDCHFGTEDCSKGMLRVAMTEPSLGLQPGDEVPAGLTLTTRDGASIDFATLYADKPVIVTFYRGGWCPYCNKNMQAWQEVVPQANELGYNVVFITMEKPELATKTGEKNKLTAPVYCDTTGAFSKAFNVLFDVDAKTQETYAQYGIDVAASNANGKWQLPHPGTFIVSTEGKVTWSHCQPDYAKGRANPEDVLAAIKAAAH